MRWFKYLCTAAILLGISANVWADDQAKESPQAPTATAAEAARPSPAQQRAEWLKTLAAIAEEQAKPQPDPQKIAALQKTLAQLRQGWVAPAGTPGTGLGTPPPVGAVCPWGGPGLGMGMGRGPGYRAGMAYGRGPGRGGPGGPGFGPGTPMGRGGFGMGPAFVDRNQNGVCDYYEYRRGW